MKLVTFDDGRVGHARRRGGRRARRRVHPRVLRARRRRRGDRRARAAGRRARCARRSCRRSSSTRPATSPTTTRSSQAVDWSHPVHKGIVFFQNVDAIIGPDDAIVYPEGLTKELDYELELGHRDRQERQVLRARGGRGLHRRLPGLQRHHRPRHPAPRDAVRRLLLLQGHRHVLPDRPVDRHQGRAPRPAEPADGAAGQRRRPPAGQHLPDASSRSRTSSRTTPPRATARATSSPPARSPASPRSSPTRSTSTSSPATRSRPRSRASACCATTSSPWKRSARHRALHHRPLLLRRRLSRCGSARSTDALVLRLRPATARSTSRAASRARCPRTRSRCSSAGTTSSPGRRRRLVVRRTT